MEALIDADVIIENLTRRGDELPDKLQKLVTEVSMIVQGNIQDAAPVRTGNLQSSIRRENLGMFSARVFPDEGIAPYAIYVMSGTNPHIIEAKNKKYLFWPGADHPVKRVWHPGTYPNPFFSYGLEASSGDIDAEVELFTNWLTGGSNDY